MLLFFGILLFFATRIEFEEDISKLIPSNSKTEEIQKGYEPPVHDFTIEQDGEDFAGSLLQEPKLVMVIAYDLRKANLEGFKEIKEVTDKAIDKGYKVIGMSASGPDQTKELKTQYDLDFEFYLTFQV